MKLIYVLFKGGGVYVMIEFLGIIVAYLIILSFLTSIIIQIEN